MPGMNSLWIFRGLCFVWSSESPWEKKESEGGEATRLCKAEQHEVALALTCHSRVRKKTPRGAAVSPATLLPLVPTASAWRTGHASVCANGTA